MVICTNVQTLHAPHDEDNGVNRTDVSEITTDGAAAEEEQ
jgi:hypothetical protein